MATTVPQPQATSSTTNGNANRAADTTQTSTFILLHGFIFMEFQKDTLVVASPWVDHHKFKVREHHGSLQDLTNPVDLRNELKSNGTVNDFLSQQILRFSRADLHLDRDFFIDLSTIPLSSFGLLLQLPLPKQILPLRLGNFSNFHPDRTGVVARSIDGHQGSETTTAVIVGLEYEATQGPEFTRSYYAEHLHAPDTAEVNKVLKAATSVFGVNASGYPFFDLQITDVDNVTAVKDPDQPGIDQDDETELEEFGLRKESVSPSTCPKLAVVS